MKARFRDVIRNYFKLPGFIITQSVLRHIPTLFQSEFPVECDLELPFSVSSIFFFSYGNPVAAYVFFLVLLYLLSFL